MKKKTLFGIFAAVLVVLNALALSSFTASAGLGNASFPNLKYQSLENSCSVYGLQLACTNMYKSESCKIHCGQTKGSTFEFAFDNRFGDYYGDYQNAQWIK